MNGDVHVVAICGSLSDDSGTRTTLEVALEGARAAGATTTLVDLREYDLPPRDGDDRDAGDAVELRETVREADAVLLGTPVYHGSYSSALKTALDYCGFDEFEDTTVGLVAVAGGQLAGRTLEHMRTVARTVNAWTLPLEVAVTNSGSAFEDGSLADEALADRTRQLGRELAEYAGVERYPEVAGSGVEAATGD